MSRYEDDQLASTDATRRYHPPTVFDSTPSHLAPWDDHVSLLRELSSDRLRHDEIDDGHSYISVVELAHRSRGSEGTCEATTATCADLVRRGLVVAVYVAAGGPGGYICHQCHYVTGHAYRITLAGYAAIVDLRLNRTTAGDVFGEVAAS